ncbi:hypothetical protein BDD12DRAFT_808819 [Trichophaea hybrida]|nr:hypothetical protein BDD12DRAFT_808819 [Trichophaea hybrida]
MSPGYTEPSFTALEEIIVSLIDQIPSGKITTTQAVANALKAQRITPNVVSTALSKVVTAGISVPTHRVLTFNYPSGYKLPFSDDMETRKQQLIAEGVAVDKNGVVANREAFWHDFDMGEMVWGRINDIGMGEE